MGTWPRNSTDEGHWTRARKRVEEIISAMQTGEQMSLAIIRAAAEINKEQLRSVMWFARKNVAKSGAGGVYKVDYQNDTIRRLTDEEASENGKRDSNKGRRHFMRARNRLTTVRTSRLSDEQTMKHRLYEAQIDLTISALSPQKRAASERKLANGSIDAGDLMGLFGA